MIGDPNPPRIGIHLEAGGAPFTVLVNGAPVWQDSRGRATILENLPILEWLTPGENTFDLQLTPPDAGEDGATASGLLTLRVDPESGADRIELARLEVSPSSGGGSAPGRFHLLESEPPSRLEPSDSGEIRVDPVQFRRNGRTATGSRTVSLPWRWPRWTFFDAPDILATTRTREDLTLQYRALWNLLSNRDTAGLRQFLATKVRELVAAHPEDRRFIEPILGLETWLNDAEMELRPLALERFQLEVVGNGKLARLVDGRGQGPIVFVRRDGMLSSYIDAMFCLGSGGWTLVR